MTILPEQLRARIKPMVSEKTLAHGHQFHSIDRSRRRHSDRDSAHDRALPDHGCCGARRKASEIVHTAMVRSARQDAAC